MDSKMKKILYIVLALVALVALAVVLSNNSLKTPDSTKPNNIELTKKEKPKAEEKQVIPPAVLKQYSDELNKYTTDIAKYKMQFNENIKKLSNKKWLNRSYDDLVGISAEDMKLIQENNSIIYYMQSAYLTSADIKATKLQDKAGAKADLNEFKRIVKGNKYIVQQEEMIRAIDNFFKQWDL